MVGQTQLINLGFVNAFLLQAEDGFILIDTGVKQQWPSLETALRRAGCLPANLKLALLTHGDFDHAGNCARLQREYRVKIAMHAGDVVMVKTGKSARRKSTNLFWKLLLWLGERMRGKIDCFEPDLLLEDDQSLAEYGLAAKVLYTPGHTKGSIAILMDDGQLFVGDTLSNWAKPAGALFIENEQELQDSLVKLNHTKAQVIYPGHGKPFSFEALAAITGLMIQKRK